MRKIRELSNNQQYPYKVKCMKLSIVVPCFNEEKALMIFYNEVVAIINALSCDYEILFIDDGSTDRTLAEMKSLASMNSHVHYFSFSRNFGKEAAMYAGLCNATGDYIAVMDADMQDPPALLAQMLEILSHGEYDSVASRRSDRSGEPPIRSWFAKRFYWVINKISDAEMIDGARDFRLMKRDMVNSIIAMGEYNRFSKGIFGWVGFRTYWISYKNIERVAGETKWSFWKLLKYAIDGITNFSQAPLSIASCFGIFMTGVASIMLLIIIIRRLIWGDPVHGWASMICAVIFIGGVQLLCIGIMGHYVAKTYLECKHRPHYIISETNVDGIKR